MNAFISCAHRGFQLLIDATTDQWAKAYDLVSAKLARDGRGGKPVVAGLVELSTIRAHRLPVPFSGSASLTVTDLYLTGPTPPRTLKFPLDIENCLL